MLDDIYLAHGAAIREICPYTGLDGSIKSLNYGRLLFAFTGKVLNNVAFNQSLYVQVEERVSVVIL